MLENIKVKVFLFPWLLIFRFGLRMLVISTLLCLQSTLCSDIMRKLSIINYELLFLHITFVYLTFQCQIFLSINYLLHTNMVPSFCQANVSLPVVSKHPNC